MKEVPGKFGSARLGGLFLVASQASPPPFRWRLSTPAVVDSSMVSLIHPTRFFSRVNHCIFIAWLPSTKSAFVHFILAAGSPKWCVPVGVSQQVETRETVRKIGWHEQKPFPSVNLLLLTQLEQSSLSDLSWAFHDSSNPLTRHRSTCRRCRQRCQAGRT